MNTKIIFGTVFPSHDKTVVLGVWKSIGDGYLLKADDKAMTPYSHTSKHCYKERNDYLTDLIINSSKLYLNRTKDTLSLYLQDFGVQTKELQSDKKFYRVKELPENSAQTLAIISTNKKF